MAVPTSFSDLSTTAASNSPSGSETPAEGDNHFRITYAFLRSILDNSGNGWTSPYWALTATGPSISATTVTWSGNPTHSGNHTFSGNVTVQGNTTLGNAGTDTVTTNGNVTHNAPSSGNSVTTANVAGAYGFYNVVSLNGGLVQNAAENTSNTSGSDARHASIVAGSSAGDPYYLFAISGVRNWGIGVDNSDSDTFKVDSNGVLGTSSNWWNVTTDGRWYGIALHNNAGAVTGTTNQYIASGTYTPTATDIANIGATTTVNGAQWVRVGNVVTVSGSIIVDPTSANTFTQVGLSLPIASNFTSTHQCSGTASSTAYTTISPAAILGDTTNDRADFWAYPPSSGSSTWVFTFQYVVV